MNEKGEVTLSSCLVIFALSGLVLLSALELRKSFRLMERRTHLFLCVKETKGELHQFLKMMGRSNWAIKNINRTSLVMMFIPGMQTTSMNVKKLKQYLQHFQNALVISYLKTIKDLNEKRCFLDPRIYITPFQLDSGLLKRDVEGAAILKDEKWTYYFLSRPYLLSLEINAVDFESVSPKIKYQASEKVARLSSHLSSL